MAEWLLSFFQKRSKYYIGYYNYYVYYGCYNRETLFRAYIAAAARRRSRLNLGCHNAAFHLLLYGPIHYSHLWNGYIHSNYLKNAESNFLNNKK